MPWKSKHKSSVVPLQQLRRLCLPVPEQFLMTTSVHQWLSLMAHTPAINSRATNRVYSQLTTSASADGQAFNTPTAVVPQFLACLARKEHIVHMPVNPA